MPYDRERHHRRSIRLRGYDYASAGMYFVTICVQNHLCKLGRITDGDVVLSRFGEIVDRCWRAIPEHFSNVTLDAYVVMPNHIHGIVVNVQTDEPEAPAAGLASPAGVGAQHAAPLRQTPQNDTSVRGDASLPQIAENTSAPHRVTPGSLGAIMRSFKAAATREINATYDAPGTPFWQRNYWERVIRNAAEYEHIYTYITSNPALWAEDRLYQPDEENAPTP